MIFQLQLGRSCKEIALHFLLIRQKHYLIVISADVSYFEWKPRYAKSRSPPLQKCLCISLLVCNNFEEDYNAMFQSHHAANNY